MKKKKYIKEMSKMQKALLVHVAGEMERIQSELQELRDSIEILDGVRSTYEKETKEETK